MQYWQMLESDQPQEKFCYGWLHRRLLRRYRPQSAMNCSTLQEQTAGSLPNTSQVSLQITTPAKIHTFWQSRQRCLQCESAAYSMGRNWRFVRWMRFAWNSAYVATSARLHPWKYFAKAFLQQVTIESLGLSSPTKIGKSHWCVPFTATFSKRRKIDALWSERCDVGVRTLKYVPFS